MERDAVKLAAPIVEAIEARETKIAMLNQAISEGWVVSDATALNESGSVPLLLANLDASTSAQVFGFAIQIYQAQLDALNSQLNAL